MSSNYQIRGILASLPAHTPERHWRLIMALETITPDGDGWRNIGMGLLGEYARLTQPHLRRARAELADAGRIEYKTTGAGRGARSWWRIVIPPSGNVNDSGSPFGNVNDSGSGSGPGNVNHPRPKREPSAPKREPSAPKREPPNALTSDNAAQCSLGALGAKRVGALSSRDRARAKLAAAVTDATGQEIDETIEFLFSTKDTPAGYISAVIANDGNADGLIDDTRDRAERRHPEYYDGNTYDATKLADRTTAGTAEDRNDEDDLMCPGCKRRINTASTHNPGCEYDNGTEPWKISCPECGGWFDGADWTYHHMRGCSFAEVTDASA